VWPWFPRYPASAGRFASLFGPLFHLLNGVREQFPPLFDEYGVDLVLTGHDHDYERTYPVRGTDAGTFPRPTVVGTDLATADTSKGTEPPPGPKAPNPRDQPRANPTPTLSPGHPTRLGGEAPPAPSP
jgi:hypothetical protein